MKKLIDERSMVVACAKQAMQKMNRSNAQSEGLIALRMVADTYGGPGAIARETGLSRATVYRTLSPEGNPRLDCFATILRSLGLYLSVEESETPITLRPLKSGAPQKNIDKRDAQEVVKDAERMAVINWILEQLVIYDISLDQLKS